MKKDTKKQKKENAAKPTAPTEYNQLDIGDYYSLVEGVALPELPLEEHQLFEQSYKQEINRRIINFTRRTGIIDSVAQGAYVMLELCAENNILLEIIDGYKTKIRQMEEKQRELNQRLQKMLDHLKDVSFKADIEK